MTWILAGEPCLVVACAGGKSTREALTVTALLREHSTNNSGTHLHDELNHIT